MGSCRCDEAGPGKLMMKVPTPKSSTSPGTRCRSLRRCLPRSWPTRSFGPSSSGCGSPTPPWTARPRCCGAICSPTGPGRCPGCGLVGVYRDTVERRVTDVPVVGHPLELRVRLPRYRCVHDGCVREVFAHDSSRLARPGASTTRRCAAFILRRLAARQGHRHRGRARARPQLGHREQHRRGRDPRVAAVRRPGPTGWGGGDRGR